MDAIKLTPEQYRIFGPEDFGAPGLVARESIGPAAEIVAFGPIVAVHDSTFEPHSGIGHHPHRGMERLFYILEGTVDHDDAFNHIIGHMGTGDLGILTEGVRGMLHSEWNHTPGRARAYIFVYPTDPTPESAAFDAVRDADAPRSQPAPGVEVKQVIGRGPGPLHGDLRELADATLDPGAAYDTTLPSDEQALFFVVEGAVVFHVNGSSVAASPEDTILVPAAATERPLRVEARDRSRVLAAVTGPGNGVIHRSRSERAPR